MERPVCLATIAAVQPRRTVHLSGLERPVQRRVAPIITAEAPLLCADTDPAHAAAALSVAGALQLRRLSAPSHLPVQVLLQRDDRRQTRLGAGAAAAAPPTSLARALLTAPRRALTRLSQRAPPAAASSADHHQGTVRGRAGDPRSPARDDTLVR